MSLPKDQKISPLIIIVVYMKRKRVEIQVINYNNNHSFPTNYRHNHHSWRGSLAYFPSVHLVEAQQNIHKFKDRMEAKKN
jgi:hypothetical protein